MGICEKIWSSGVSPKIASKMQLRNVDLRSVGPFVQKLWQTTFFARKMPCILHCNEKKIWTSFCRLDRGLVQKAKWSEISRRSRIQAVPTISNNLCQCLGLLTRVTSVNLLEGILTHHSHTSQVARKNAHSPESHQSIL